MRLLQVAVVLAMVGVVLCLWLLEQVTWYTFVAFMLVAQPLLLIAIVLFAIAALKDLRHRTGTPS